MRLRSCLLICITVFGFPVAGWAHPKAVQNNDSISMKSVEALNQRGTGPVLIGGREAKSVDWPASFYSEAAGSRCTATLVGPKVLILAAHCVGNGKNSSIEFRNKPYSGKCTHADEYKGGSGDESADYALCLLTEPVGDVKYETVNRNPTRVKKGEFVLLTGFGCTNPPARGSNEPTGGNDGKFRIGSAKVVAIPGDISDEPNTILTKDEAVVCPGDSGSGAFKILTPAKRILVSVNSRVWFDKKESYLSSTSTNVGLKFIGDWLDKPENKTKGATICGFNESPALCR